MVKAINRLGDFCSAKFSPINCSEPLWVKLITSTGGVFGYCRKHEKFITCAVTRAGYKIISQVSARFCTSHLIDAGPVMRFDEGRKSEQEQQRPTPPPVEATERRREFSLSDLGLAESFEDPDAAQAHAYHLSRMRAFKNHLYRTYPSRRDVDPWEDGALALHVLKDLEQTALGWECQGPHVVVKMLIDRYQEMVEQLYRERVWLKQTEQANRFLVQCIEAYRRELDGAEQRAAAARSQTTDPD
jgi:hypothetical protein